MATTLRPLSTLPSGTAFARYIQAKAFGRGDAHRALVIAERWMDSPQVKACLEDELRGKAAIAPGTTSDATFAAPLAAHGIAAEALELTRGLSILGALENKFRRVPFRTNVPRETGTGTGGAWTGEALSIPAAQSAYDTLSQSNYKAQVITVLTTELLQFSRSAERALRETVAAGLAAYLDQQLLTNTVTLSANVRPAAITNGATAIVSTGTTAAQINADLAGLLAAITTNGQNLAWVMRPGTLYRIAATIGGTAAVDVPRTLFGIPLVLSANSPQQVTLIDCSHILYSDDGGIEVDASDEATVQLNTTPTDPAVAATVFQSLWDNNLFAVRATRWVAWLRAQSGAVSYMTTAY